MNKYCLITSAVFSSIILLFSSAFSQNSTINIEQIMQGTSFVGNSPSIMSWSPDGKKLYFRWNPRNLPEAHWYQTDSRASEPIMLIASEQDQMVRAIGDFNDDRSSMIFSKNGDLFLWQSTLKEPKQLTNTISRESNPRFSQDEQAIIYQSSGNLYKWELAEGKITQLSDFRNGSSQKEKPLSQQNKWLKEDQLSLIQILDERAKSSDYRDSVEKSRSPKRPLTIYAEDSRIVNLDLSPDERYITYTRWKSSRSGRTDVPDYVTASAYTENLNARAKVGSPQSKRTFWIYDRERDTTYQLHTKSIPGIKDKPLFLKDYLPQDSLWNPQYSKARTVTVNGPMYNKNGSKAIVVIRSEDHKDRWIMLLDLETASLSQLDRQRDEAWIGGPGISSWGGTGNIGWLDEEHIYFQSESTGYSHLYMLNTSNRKKKALTKGNFEIMQAQLSNDKRHFYLLTNERHPGEQHLYKLNIEDGKKTQITRMAGGYSFSISPNESHIAMRYSNSNTPWELYVMPNRAGGKAKQITDSRTEAFKNYPWREPEIITFKASDGADVYARLYKDDDQEENGPAVIFVHGAGYLQNVHKRWSSYYREYMFHNFLVDQGYTVLDIDYRASSGYGRDWRTGIYRHMGGKDLSDQIDGVRYLIEEQKVDSGRIGIYGGSYGGFITLMALFNHPGVFKCGAALRSVTDWAHYNHGYTSNILNTPVEDSIAYKQSSPIYFAEGLEDHLLMLHGMVDTNVQFQDVVRLSQRLIELGKENWELAVFPMEGHGFVEASSWTDEYKRIFKLFETHLKSK